jgi:hypothetical protein
VAIQIMKKPQYKIPNEYPLKGKLRCGVCRLAMSYLEKSYGQSYYCSHKSKTGKYSQCCSEYIPTEIIEKAVWNILYTQLKILHELSVKIEPKKGVSSQNMVTKCKCMEKDIATMKAERIRQYEAYAEGIITREQYLLRKTELTEQIQKIQETLQRFWFVVEKDKTMTEEIIRINEQANEQMIGDKLTKKMVDTFIETVYVYDSKTIEVQFVFDDLLQEAIQKYA